MTTGTGAASAHGLALTLLLGVVLSRNADIVIGVLGLAVALGSLYRLYRDDPTSLDRAAMIAVSSLNPLVL